MYEAGEVDLYYGRRGQRIDPRTEVPDVIFYGDEAGGKFGISVASAGDVTGDGHDDLLIAAGFHSVPGPNGRPIPSAGEVYLVYGGYLNKFRCPVKVRAQEIGRTVPGIMFEGGLDGGRYTGGNELDAGDFSGDHLNDIVIGSYDPYSGSHPTFPARAYVILGVATYQSSSAAIDSAWTPTATGSARPSHTAESVPHAGEPCLLAPLSSAI